MKKESNFSSSDSDAGNSDTSSNQKEEKKTEEAKPQEKNKSTEKEPESTNPEEKKKDTDTPEEDPFVYKFDGADDNAKKSGDGVWLAVVAIVVIIAIIIIGTSRKNAQEEKDNNNNESVASSIIEQDNPNENSELSEPKEEEMSDDEKMEATEEEGSMENGEQPEEAIENTEAMQEEEGPIQSASSTLVDTSALKFDYSPKQVVDKDFSTAWIEAERDAGINETLTINFGEEKEISRIGIVPGYGRDSEIYNENNRIKKLSLTFSDGTVVEKDLEDIYAMHMLEFDQRKTSSVMVTIKEVYSGLKYNDTAISEIDIESDYVINNDPDGAMRFYEENKKDNAKKPL